MENQDQPVAPLTQPVQLSPIPRPISPPLTTPSTPITPSDTAPLQNQFIVSDVIDYSWKMALKHFGLFIKVSLPAVILMLLGFIIGILAGEEPGAGIAAIVSLIGLLLSLANLLVVSNIMVLSFLVVDNKIPEGKSISIYVGKDSILTFMLASFIYSFKIILWTFLFIIPGIYKGLKHYFAVWVAFDSRTYKGAYGKSGDLTKGVMWKLIWLSVLIYLINIAGLLAFGLGLIITMPLTFIAYTYTYRLLAGNRFTVEKPINPQGTGSTPLVPVV